MWPAIMGYNLIETCTLMYKIYGPRPAVCFSCQAILKYIYITGSSCFHNHGDCPGMCCCPDLCRTSSKDSAASLYASMHKCCAWIPRYTGMNRDQSVWCNWNQLHLRLAHIRPWPVTRLHHIKFMPIFIYLQSITYVQHVGDIILRGTWPPLMDC